jgi:two-component system nitrogen regulation sensor histidine kinase GlnL
MHVNLDCLRFQAFDLLSTLIAVARADGAVLFVNTGLEDALGASRRALTGSALGGFFDQPQVLRTALEGAARNDFATWRYEALLRRASHELMPVQVTITRGDGVDEFLIEMSPLEQQARQDREERRLDQAQANKELIRNLAHEIKNPLGGIRGAAQLLQMEVSAQGLIEYTEVIIHEADRLQALVDRLLAPHRQPHVIGEVNIHEVCDHVCALILAEFPQGLRIERDFDVSIPEFRGDRERLIQALLNIVHNAAQALAGRRAAGDARITLRTRVARQVIINQQWHRLALELHVIDNGPGVPQALKERLFYPLVSGREGGSGLGLTLAQTFVQQHRGAIECDSEPGRTDFRVLIPLA